MMPRVLLLRSVKEGESKDKYQEVFSAAGVDCVSISPIGFDFTNLDTLFSHINHPEDFSGIIFSSPRTVQSVVLCLHKCSSGDEWNSKFRHEWSQRPAFSVGTSTACAIRDLGLTPIGEDSGNAENLVKIILEAIQPGSKPLLYPCGTMRRETIPKSLEKEGVNFTADVVYQTVANPNLSRDIAVYLQDKGAPDCVVFFSPSGVQYSREVLQRHQSAMQGTKFLAIGDTTRVAMEEHGYIVAATAEKPNPEALLQAINRCQNEDKS